MKLVRIILGLVTALSISIVFPAGAQFNSEVSGHERAYVRVEVGSALVQDGKLTCFNGPVSADVDYQVGFAVGATIGYNINRSLAAELEFGGLAVDIKSVTGYYSRDTYLNNIPFVFNLTYWPTVYNTRIIPYVGAGLGGSVTIFGTDGFGTMSQVVYGDQTDVVFVWHVFAGTQIWINPTMSLGVSYKYFATEDSSFSFPPLFPELGQNLIVRFNGLHAHLLSAAFQVRF